MDYEYLYSGERKEMIFTTTASAIPIVFSLVCSTLSTIGLQALGFQQSNPADDDDAYYPPQKSEVITYVQVTNLILPILFQILILFAYTKFPIDQTKMSQIHKEIENRDYNAEDYQFYDPVSPSYITKHFSLESLNILCHDYGNKYINTEGNGDGPRKESRREVLLTYMQQRLTFYYSFSAVEMHLLQYKEGKPKVRSRYIVDTCLLLLYTLVILSCTLMNLAKDKETNTSVLLVLLFVVLPFTVYELLRWKAMNILSTLPSTQVNEEAIMISKLRRIESTNYPLTPFQLFLKRLPFHLFFICLSIFGFIITFIPTILPFTVIN